jgi:hypothetical protein
MIGMASVKGDVPFWHICLSPLLMPILLGAFVGILANK